MSPGDSILCKSAGSSPGRAGASETSSNPKIRRDNMLYIFRGHLCGYICSDCPEDLANVKVRLYRVRDDQNRTALASAEPKNTFKILSEKEIQQKEQYLLAESGTDDEGRFRFELDEDQDYNGEAFEVDVSLESVPGLPENVDRDPVQVSITTLQPQWRKSEEGAIFGWEYCIPERWWCRVRELFGVWTICGQVTHCQSGQSIGAGSTVIAFDRDWIQDDEIGSATTDADGKFRIDYIREDFEPGVLIDVELIGGPDLYFRVESPAGQPLLKEDPSKGRTPARENAGPCFCVDLCVEEEPPNGDGGPETYPAFTHVGGYDFITDIDSGSSGTGETVGSGRAFFRNLRLNGIVSKKFKGADMEYKFQYKDLDAGGSWTDVDPSTQIGRTKLGVLEKWAPVSPTDPNPIKTKDYIIGDTPDSDELAASLNGVWIQVPQENNVFGSDGSFVPNGNQMQLNSRTLATFTPNVDLSGLDAGNSSTSTGKSLVQNKHFSLRMIVRKKGDSSSETVAGLLERIAINNRLYDYVRHPNWMAENVNGGLAVVMVNIDQLKSSGCEEIKDKLDVLFTAAHPNLGNVSISMKGPGGPYSIAVPHPGSGGGTAEDRYGTANSISYAPGSGSSGPVDVKDLKPCSYIVTLSVQVLLTTGDSVPSNRHDQISFCKA